MEKRIKIGIVGCGTIGSSILNQILKKRILKNRDIFINDKDKEKEKKILQRYRVRRSEIKELINQADFIILAIKPKDFFYFAKEDIPAPNKVFISVMAGISLRVLKKILKTKKIVRAMPNLMIEIGKGIIVWKEEGLNFEEVKIVREIFNTLGREIKVGNEKLINQATLISGCGPAYLYFFEDLLLKSFKKLGFSKEFTFELLVDTFLGALLYQKEKKYSVEELIKKIATKGGVTEKFLETLKKEKILESFKKAAKNAFLKLKRI